MKLSDLLQELVDGYDGPPAPDLDDEPKVPTCTRCRWDNPLNENGLCAECQETIDRGYEVSQLAGRCANGWERDSGSLWHARVLHENGETANWKAVCGYQPGRRSAGWSVRRSETGEVTCKRCLRKLNR